MEPVLEESRWNLLGHGGRVQEAPLLDYLDGGSKIRQALENSMAHSNPQLDAHGTEQLLMTGLITSLGVALTGRIDIDVAPVGRGIYELGSTKQVLPGRWPSRHGRQPSVALSQFALSPTSVGCFHELEGPLCVCPYTRRPTTWDLY